MQEKKTSEGGYNRNSQEDQWSGETEPRPEIHDLPPQVKRENYQMAGLKTKRELFNVAASGNSWLQKTGMFLWIDLHCNLKRNQIN